MALLSSPTFRTPPLPHLPPSDPLRAPLGQVLSLRNQTLVNRTGEKGDAMPADLVAKVLAGNADRPRAGWFEDIPLKELPLLSGGRRWHRESRGHRTKADTPVLLTGRWWGQGVH
jgi:hypothetical protein